MRRVAMITGASGGVGAAAALLLAERGFRVVVNHHASARRRQRRSRQLPRPVARPSRFRAMSRRQVMLLGW